MCIGGRKWLAYPIWSRKMGVKSLRRDVSVGGMVDAAGQNLFLYRVSVKSDSRNFKYKGAQW